MTVEAQPESPPSFVWYLDVVDEAATVSLAADIASLVQPGDLVTLSGELGSGKTTFARALIRALTGEPELDVPSPTFTLLQVYDSAVKDAARFPIVHADLFRIKDPSELAELGWDEAAEGALVIVEWPERAGGGLAGERLDIAFPHRYGEGAGLPHRGGDRRRRARATPHPVALRARHPGARRLHRRRAHLHDGGCLHAPPTSGCASQTAPRRS